MSYWIHPNAEGELGDAAVYYATHASNMIAAAFLAEYERVIELLVENQQRAHTAKLVCASTTLIVFLTRSCTKLMKSRARRYLPSPIRAVNRDIGVIEHRPANLRILARRQRYSIKRI